MNGDTDRRLLLLDAEDNVLIATSRIRAEETVMVGGAPIVLSADLPIGHKLARRAIVPARRS